MDKNERIYLNEANTMPGFADTSMYPKHHHSEYDIEQLVSQENIERWTSIHGELAEQWLATLPSIVSGQLLIQLRLPQKKLRNLPLKFLNLKD